MESRWKEKGLIIIGQDQNLPTRNYLVSIILKRIKTSWLYEQKKTKTDQSTTWCLIAKSKLQGNQKKSTMKKKTVYSLDNMQMQWNNEILNRTRTKTITKEATIVWTGTSGGVMVSMLD